MRYKDTFLLLLFIPLFVLCHSCAPSSVGDILQSSLWELTQIESKKFPLIEGEASIHQYIYFARDGYVYELMLSEIKGIQVLVKKDVKTKYNVLDDQIKIGNYMFELEKKERLKALEEESIKITFEKTKKLSVKDANNAEIVEVGLSIFQ